LKKVRSDALAALLATTALLFGGITPDVAQAAEAANWPLSVIGMTPTSMTVFNDDNVALDNCSNQGQPLSFEYFHEGYAASSLATSTSANGGVACGGDTALNTPDGTLYTMSNQPSGTTPTAMFAAMKNGRTLWQTDVSSDPGLCSSANGSHDAKMTSASQGSDGNIYGIVQSPSYGCATYLTKVSGTDGTVLFKLPLTSDGSGKATRLWVYGDHLTTIDYTGKVRQFTYNAAENTAVTYQFPSSLGMFGNAYANAAGRVFAVGMCSGSVTDTVLAYYDPTTGDNYAAPSGLGCGPSVNYTPGANGTLVAYDYYGTVKTFSFTTTGITSSTTSVPDPSGVSNVFVYNYWQDSGGNAVMLRQLYGPSWSRIAVTADEIDGTTGTVINLLTVGVNSTHPSPSLKTGDVSPDGSALYMAICHDVSACPNSATTIDAWLHKVPLTGFGPPIKDTNSFTTYTSTRLNYVAMGDSFSSGEGNTPFISGTDISGTNTCHRSSAAYSEQLEKAGTSNLNLTNFVACSGATTTNVQQGGQFSDEPPQVTFLNASTNVVTITIGGNDIGFSDFASACVTAECDPSTTIYQTTMGNISNVLPGSLKTTYEQILQDAPKAQIYVLDYPYVVPNKSASDPAILGCAYLYGGQSPWANDQGAWNVISSLDTTIENEVSVVQSESSDYGSRLHHISANSPGSPFAGHTVCDTGDSFFQNIDQAGWNQSTKEYVFHPNANGQLAYANLVANAIG